MRMKNYVAVLAALLISTGIFAQKSEKQDPYSSLGHTPYIIGDERENELKNAIFVIEDLDGTRLEQSPRTGIVRLFDKEGKLISETKLKEHESAWGVPDPKAEKYVNISPYAYVANNPMKFIDPNGEEIYILYYTTGNSRGDNMFQAAAQTRMYEIMSRKGFDSSKDMVLMLPITDISDVGSLSEIVALMFGEQFGKTAEIGVWSHGSLDGPAGTEETSVFQQDGKQMSVEGWGSFNFNWSDNAKFNFYGCRTAAIAHDDGRYQGSFAQNVSTYDNMTGVEVAGQPYRSYPSNNPYIRSTNWQREAGIYKGNTYMGAGNPKEGIKAHFGIGTVHPMHVYKNGNYIRSSPQGR